MDNQQPSSSASPAANFSAQSKKQATQKTVAQLLDDKNAMDDWTNNIEKIRQKETGGATRHTS
jgi:hypothetical protein